MNPISMISVIKLVGRFQQKRKKKKGKGLLLPARDTMEGIFKWFYLNQTIWCSHSIILNLSDFTAGWLPLTLMYPII